MRITTILLTICSLACCCRAAEAEIIVIGPRPYLSAADSPFDLSGLGTTFFLEDFEDGELNTPGIFNLQIPGGTLVKPPSPLTDSVDGDAGPIDGLGISGHSLESAFTTCTFSDPPHCQTAISLAFDSDALGFLPNAFGFVWTDATPNSRLRIAMSDANAETIAEFVLDETFGDSQDSGQTAE